MDHKLFQIELFKKISNLYTQSLTGNNEPFTLWLTNNRSKYVFNHGGNGNTEYSHIGFVKQGTKSMLQAIGLSFTDKNNNPTCSLTLNSRLLNPSVNTQKNLNNLYTTLKTISVAGVKSEFTQHNINYLNLASEIQNVYNEVFKRIKDFDKKNSTKFYDFFKIPVKTYNNKVNTANNKLNSQSPLLGHENELVPTDPKNQPKDTKNTTKPPLNLILYGPPGTGKTHCTVDKALERLLPKHELDSLNAITPKDDKRKAQEEKFNELKKQGRIVFTTFHQSMSYEDFIEGIKPETDDDGNVTYEVKPGIFKQLCKKAKLSQTSSNFNEAYNTFINDLTSAGYYGNNPSKFVTSNKSTFGISVNSKGNLSLFTGNPLKKQGTITKDNLELRFLGNSNYNYWESYFKRIIEHLEDRYQLQQENRPNNNNYVLIIDEINRGNVANIFGELISLIEDNKRGQQRVKVTLPYSHDDFSVPENLYIIGTMNTADRSVEALDTALRRRFSFEEMMPEPELLNNRTIIVGNHKYDLSELLNIINKRIELLKDREHQIGHSYLMKVSTEAQLTAVFFDKIIPLLQEYFYGDYEKIQLVLGDGFVMGEKPSVTFANNKTFDGLPEMVYSIAKYNRNEPGNFDLSNALKKLMNISEKKELTVPTEEQNPES